MPRVQQPGLKPTHKLVQAYYAALAQFDRHHVTRETAVRQPFLDLLRAAAGQRGWSVEPEFPMQGSHRRENITDWALEEFRRRYPPGPSASPLTKWDIFYYGYAILHHPQYRERYAANLRRELPRIAPVGIQRASDRLKTSPQQSGVAITRY